MFLTKICEALNKAKIGYAVVGGYAVALHGAVRGTLDLDLIISFEEDSFTKAEWVFLALGLQSRLPVTAKEIFHFRKEYIKNRNLIAWSFYDPVSPANQLDIIITHDFRKMRIDVLTIEGTKVKVISIKDLIEMKKKSSRPQDKEDIKALRGILNNEEK